MPKLKNTPPKYRLHRASGQAVRPFKIRRDVHAIRNAIMGSSVFGAVTGRTSSMSQFCLVRETA